LERCSCTRWRGRFC